MTYPSQNQKKNTVPPNSHNTPSTSPRGACSYELDSDDGIHQKLSSIMIYNTITKQYETPPPRWFNRDTGDFEPIKPIYLLDPHNPATGFVAPVRIAPEDAQFRAFLAEKEGRRRARMERERVAGLQPAEEPAVRREKGKEREERGEELAGVEGLEFDEEVAQRMFRERRGVMMSKRGATKFIGPSALGEANRRAKLKKYRALKPLGTEDEPIESLPPIVNEEEILAAWKSSPEVKVEKKPRREGERVKSLVVKGGRKGWSFDAMRGSYRPPKAVVETGETGWTDEPKLLGAETLSPEKTSMQDWRHRRLEIKAWWDRDAVRQEKGRLTINPVTGKLEDLVVNKKRGDMRADILVRRENRVQNVERVIDLLAESPPRMDFQSLIETKEVEKLEGPKMTFASFLKSN